MAVKGRRAGLSLLAFGCWAVACGGKHSTSAAPDSGGGADPGSSGSASAPAGAGPTGAAGSKSGAGSGGAAAGTASGGAGPDGLAGASDDGGAGGAPEVELPLDWQGARSGSFKMLVYSSTQGYRHDPSIVSGKAMLQQIASEQGFEVVMTETNELITPAGLQQFEIVFFLNTSGDVFDQTEELAFEEWMTTRQGAFVGVHAATDTENGWAFYSEVTGQYFNGHGAAGVVDDIVFEASALNHPAVQGLPNPWPRAEEWSKFNSHQFWTTKPGFQVLARKAADGQPIIWTREWGNFRSFYSGLGHDASVFEDAAVKQHITGGIMWAVRREALIK